MVLLEVHMIAAVLISVAAATILACTTPRPTPSKIAESARMEARGKVRASVCILTDNERIGAILRMSCDAATTDCSR